jgi:hypothetical protein
VVGPALAIDLELIRLGEARAQVERSPGARQARRLERVDHAAAEGAAADRAPDHRALLVDHLLGELVVPEQPAHAARDGADGGHAQEALQRQERQRRHAVLVHRVHRVEIDERAGP